MKKMRVKLVVVQGRPEGKHLVFPPGDYYFGRGAECHVRPNSAMISRQHCILRVDETGASLRDMGSRNGTLVNGLLISKEQRLNAGDLIQLGPLVFKLQIEVGKPATAGPKQLGLETVAGPETYPEIALPGEQDVPDVTKETEDSHPSYLPPKG
jgi:pSer/pThr/pTyr-binding forkhead associated (FHA) protein